ncbi:MAG: acyl-CoA thioesterase [Eubacteriales bacterium]|nr:acyl-CoA thioesterase [Eubacteriales bacterium]
MFEYEHKVQYYETDQMQIVHHSNYIRWFEEARMAMMESTGFGYEKMETQGVIIPVVEAQASYRSMVRFGETVLIRPKIKKFNGAVLEIIYDVVDKKTGVLRCQGRTKHAFLDAEGHLISLKYAKPEFYDYFRKLESAQTEPVTKGAQDPDKNPDS